MTDHTMSPGLINVQAKVIQQLRRICASERPDDFVFELTTVDGKQHFLFPAAGLPELVQKNTSFAIGTAPKATSQTTTIA